ncbi:MFS transporter [Burkholderiaceae bacterium FT117]|uniref:MFS transporter n=1 Tax=Zeimonas sediminis TaxID=2944268 RepID=UPI0023431B30|nr:MFS transporter [Zeimonas sediminis]MCM5571344.1 MFS transporter [Zeimonas sediminis]
MNPALPDERSLRAAIRALTFGNFAIGTGVMVVVGMLDLIAEGLRTSVPTAGQLVTIGALVTCIGAPLTAALTSRIDRRSLLVGSLALSGLGHLLSALAPGFGLLAAVRAATMVQAAIFTPQAAATIGSMVPPEGRARAVTGIFIGWSIASVIGMPLGNLVGTHFGWRAGFGVAALLNLAACAWVFATIPRGLRTPALSLSSWGDVVRNPLLTGALAVTLLGGAGQFTLSAYIAPALKLATQASAEAVAAVMGLFGLFGVAGNLWMIRQIGRRGPDRSVDTAILAIVVGLGLAALLTLAVAWLPAATWPLLLASGVFWGLGCFAMNSAQQARLAAFAPALASASIALNTSMIYGGQAIGAAAGGAVIAVAGIGPLPWAAVALMLATLWLSRRVGARAAVARMQPRA